MHRVRFTRLPDDSAVRQVYDARTASDVLSINEPLDFQSRVIQWLFTFRKEGKAQKSHSVHNRGRICFGQTQVVCCSQGSVLDVFLAKSEQREAKSEKRKTR